MFAQLCIAQERTNSNYRCHSSGNPTPYSRTRVFKRETVAWLEAEAASTFEVRVRVWFRPLALGANDQVLDWWITAI